MNIPGFFLEPASYSVDFDELHYLRRSVFVIEQQIPEDLEFDELDPQCYHYIVRDTQCHPIGTARLTAEGKIGRMAVLSEWRKQGVGASLLQALIEKARSLGLTKVTAHAQVSALSFYEKHGFTRQGEVFIEAGIPHQAVQYLLPLREKHQRPLVDARAPTVEATRLEGLETTRAASLQLIQQARRQLFIYSRDLDTKLYGQAEVLEALKQFVLLTRQASVQVLIQEPEALQSQTHPLLSLAQRLPSYFLIRTPIEDEDLQYPSAFVVNDREGYLFRLQEHRYEGHWSPHLPTQSRQLREEFDRVWQRSRPCTEFRVLGL